MIGKVLAGLVLTGVVGLAGCQSNVYACRMVVEGKGDGISDYREVAALPKGQYPATMPVVVTSKKSVVHDDESLFGPLCVLSLGVIPGFTSQTTIGHVTVETPLGSKSGTYIVEARGWYGLLAIFPYPGTGDIRDSLGHFSSVPEDMAKKKLVARLVSQFPKEEYRIFLKENNTP